MATQHQCKSGTTNEDAEKIACDIVQRIRQKLPMSPQMKAIIHDAISDGVAQATAMAKRNYSPKLQARVEGSLCVFAHDKRTGAFKRAVTSILNIFGYQRK